MMALLTGSIGLLLLGAIWMLGHIMDDLHHIMGHLHRTGIQGGGIMRSPEGFYHSGTMERIEQPDGTVTYRNKKQ